jgi:hypothetical protein
MVVCEHRKRNGCVRGNEPGTQRQTKTRQPVSSRRSGRFRFEGRNQLLRLWIKLLVQQDAECVRSKDW